jgi:hypothetical protein
VSHTNHPASPTTPVFFRARAFKSWPDSVVLNASSIRYLYDNGLTGGIPTEIGLLAELQQL